MISQDLKNCIDEVEACTDEAKRAMQSAQAPDSLRECVELMHTRAKQAQQEASSVDEDAKMTACVNDLEQAADRAMQACRTATNLSPQMMQAVQRAHDEASRLKKQLQAMA